jgi:hypothetical protein
MRLNRSRLNWGVFFIVLGAVPLAYQQGAVSAAQLSDVWRLWPLALVGIGLGLVLSRTPANFVGGLVVAACVGLVFGSLFAVGPRLGCNNHGGTTTTVSRDGTFSGNARVDLELQCGGANVSASPDGQWHIQAANTGGDQADIIPGTDSLIVRSSDRNHWWLDRGEDTWQVQLPAGNSIALSASVNAGTSHFDLAGANLSAAHFEMNAGELHVNLSNAKLGNLSVSTNVGAAYVTLDGASPLTGSFDTNVGSLDVCFPSQLGLRLTSTESLASTNYSGAGLVRVGDAWQTPGYDTAAAKADFSVSVSVGSMTLNPAGGCK